MNMLKGLSENITFSMNDLGNNFIKIRNFLDVGHVSNSMGKMLKEGLYESCENANKEFKKSKKLDMGIHVSYHIDIMQKENKFKLHCNDIGNTQDCNKVTISMENITYENFVLAYEIATKQYIINYLNDKINNICEGKDKIFTLS